MSASDLALRFLAGGLVVMLVSLLARSSQPMLAGLMVLFPAVTLVSFAFLADSTTSDNLRRVSIFSVYSLPATVGFLLAFALGVQRLGARTSLAVAVAVWLVIASALVLFNRVALHL